MDIDQRLAVYDLTEKQLLTDRIVVPSGVKLTLYAPSHHEHAREGNEQHGSGYNRLFPKSMEDVKRWVGVSDEVGRLSKNCCQSLSDVAFVDSPQAVKGLSPSQRQTLFNIARTYVYGDSTTVSSYLPSINHLIAKFNRYGLAGLFVGHDIDVLPRGILQISASIKVLFADKIRIWRGGAIYLDSSTKIDCASIVGNYHEIHIPQASSASLLNYLGKTEVVAEGSHV